MNELLEHLRLTRRAIINMLDEGLKTGLITQKERDVFYYRHIDWMSLEQCGKQFGVTRERVRQIENKVMEKFNSA